MGMETRFDTVGTATYAAPTAPAALTALAETITWSSNTPSISYTPTIAQGDIITSTETGIEVFTHNAQITALIADVLALRTALLLTNTAVAASAVDVAACKTLLDAGL